MVRVVKHGSLQLATTRTAGYPNLFHSLAGAVKGTKLLVEVPQISIDFFFFFVFQQVPPHSDATSKPLAKPTPTRIWALCFPGKYGVFLSHQKFNGPPYILNHQNQSCCCLCPRSCYRLCLRCWYCLYLHLLLLSFLAVAVKFNPYYGC